jgi:hypothetical protein
MSDQLTIAALASALALAALCLQAPAISARGAEAGAAWLKATAGVELPAVTLPSLLR